MTNRAMTQMNRQLQNPMIDSQKKSLDVSPKIIDVLTCSLQHSNMSNEGQFWENAH